MGMVAIRCSKCGKMQYTDKRNFMEGFRIVKNRPMCKECENQTPYYADEEVAVFKWNEFFADKGRKRNEMPTL